MYKEKKFKELSDWIVIDGYCATRIKIDGNVNNVADRVAFIEKTPRVRLEKNKYSVENEDSMTASSSNRDAWLYGYKNSEYGMSKKSREWCDRMLELLGYE